MHGIVSAPVYGVGVYFFGCLAAGLVPVVGALTAALHVSVRRGFKRHHGIAAEPGCAGADVALAVCCEPCITCQEVREMDIRAFGQNGGVAMAVLPTMFVPPGGMVMNPMQQQQAYPQQQQQQRQAYPSTGVYMNGQPVYGMQQAQQAPEPQPFYTATVSPRAGMPAPPPPAPVYGQPAYGQPAGGSNGEPAYYAK